jgi:hypothetical protein
MTHCLGWEVCTAAQSCCGQLIVGGKSWPKIGEDIFLTHSSVTENTITRATEIGNLVSKMSNQFPKDDLDIKICHFLLEINAFEAYV